MIISKTGNLKHTNCKHKTLFSCILFQSHWSDLGTILSPLFMMKLFLTFKLSGTMSSLICLSLEVFTSILPNWISLHTTLFIRASVNHYEAINDFKIEQNFLKIRSFKNRTGFRKSHDHPEPHKYAGSVVIKTIRRKHWIVIGSLDLLFFK